MPLSVLLEAAADDVPGGNSDLFALAGAAPSPEAESHALDGGMKATDAADTDDGTHVGVGAGCLLIRLRDGNGGEDIARPSVLAPRPETCVVGWLGLGGAGPTVMLFCAANDLSILRELY